MDTDFKSHPFPLSRRPSDSSVSSSPLTEALASVFKSYFPEQFQFYHLGSVTLHPRTYRDRSNDQRIFYQLEGDLRGTFKLFLPNDQDLSIYLEMGNILLGKFTTQLADTKNLEVIFSPPQTQKKQEDTPLRTHSSDPCTQRIHLSYQFENLGKSEIFEIELEILRLKETGHA